MPGITPHTKPRPRAQNENKIPSGPFTLSEQNIYGSSREGVIKPNKRLDTATIASTVIYNRIGDKQYQHANHLGNVLATVSDVPFADNGGSGSVTLRYKPDYLSGNAYSSLGAPLAENDWNWGTEYRYGFQNQEEDNELKGEGNSVNFEYRMHDTRLGRFFAVDPADKVFPGISTYNFAANSPIICIDVYGKGPRIVIYSPQQTSEIKAALKSKNYKEVHRIIAYGISNGYTDNYMPNRMEKELGVRPPANSTVTKRGDAGDGIVEIIGFEYDENGKLKEVSLGFFRDPFIYYPEIYGKLPEDDYYKNSEKTPDKRHKQDVPEDKNHYDMEGKPMTEDGFGSSGVDPYSGISSESSVIIEVYQYIKPGYITDIKKQEYQIEGPGGQISKQTYYTTIIMDSFDRFQKVETKIGKYSKSNDYYQDTTYSGKKSPIDKSAKPVSSDSTVKDAIKSGKVKMK